MILKKYVVFVMVLFTVGLLHAQRVSSSQKPFTRPQNTHSFQSANKANGFIQINYFEEDETKFGVNYERILVPINEKYTTSIGDSLIRYAVIGFDSIPNHSNERVRNLSQVTIDSIFLEIGHQNISNTTDTIIFSLVKADTNGFPLSQVYWTDTMTTIFSLSSGNDWKNTFVHKLPFHQAVDDFSNFALIIRYLGDLNDTFGIVAAYPFAGNCASIQDKRALKSSFYSNSFAYWNQWNLLLPSAVGGDVFYDCDSDGIYNDSIDGENFIQNWHIGVQISSPSLSNHSDQLSMMYIFPNPVSDWLTITNAPSGGSLEIFTMDGKLIQKNNVHGENESISVAHLINGLYIIKIQYLDKIHYAKIVVAH